MSFTSRQTISPEEFPQSTYIVVEPRFILLSRMLITCIQRYKFSSNSCRKHHEIFQNVQIALKSLMILSMNRLYHLNYISNLVLYLVVEKLEKI